MLLDIDKNGKCIMNAMVISSPQPGLLLFVNIFLVVFFIFKKVVNFTKL